MKARSFKEKRHTQRVEKRAQKRRNKAQRAQSRHQPVPRSQRQRSGSQPLIPLFGKAFQSDRKGARKDKAA